MNNLEYIIVTNNPNVKNKYKNICFIDGTVEEVFNFIRTKLHEGKRLLTHPLSASLKMLHSPYRSIIISKEGGNLDINSIDIMESSIFKYKQCIKWRAVDVKNSEDYAFIDLTLLNSAYKELVTFI